MPGRGMIVADLAPRLAVFIGGYVAMLALPWPYDLLGVLPFSIATVSLLGSWFHDGVHRTVAGSARGITAMRQLAAAPVGFSPRWWYHKHVRLHHRYPGDPTFDPDIQFGYLGRVTPAQPWRPLHSTQHLTMWLFMPLVTLNMLKPQELWLARRYARKLGYRIDTPGWVFLIDKYLPTAIMWTPVFLTHRLSAALFTFLAFHAITGVLSSIVTQVQHNTTPTVRYGPQSDRHPMCEQLLRSSDVGSAHGIWWWLCGGVNLHVAHHLAPTLSFLELPAVTARLRAELRAAGLDVPTHRHIAAAVASHARLIKSLSRQSPEESSAA